MGMSDWIRTKLPEKVFDEGAGERYLQQDWEIAPTPEAVVQAGLAATIEEAAAGIAASKQWWGGTRGHVPFDTFEENFGALWPTQPFLFGAKPVVFDKLKQANDVDGDKGFGNVFEDWRDRNLIK